MKGFLGGVSIGALVAVGGAAMWSLSSPLPDRVQVDTSAADQSSQPDVAEAQVPEASERRDADLVEAVPSSPAGSSSEDTSPVAVLDITPGNRPVVGTAEGSSAGDVTEGAVAALPQAPSAVTVETTTTAAPDAPGQETTPIVSTETAAVPAPPAPAEVQTELPVEAQITGSEETASGESTVTDSQAVSAAEASVDAEPAAAAEGGADIGASALAETGAASQGNAPVVVDLSGPNLGSAPVPTALPGISTSPASPIQIGEADRPETEEAPQPQASQVAPIPEGAEPDPTAEAEQEQEQLTSAQGAATGSRLGTRVVPLTERDNSPTLVDGETAAPAEERVDDRPPFAANAEVFAVLGDRPLMSIVLIDDAAAIGAEALEDFPYPLTFAISPDDPKAAEKMQARRAAGFEVMILADLPREAVPQDAETAMAVWMQKMPLAVGVLEGVETGFQGNRPLADQMVTVMQAAGFGMVTQNSGLNTVQKLALRDGLPSGVVFRDFDGAGQNPRAIRRFLDQAAFRARQEGAVIMLGRLRPDTISALLLWGLQDRASQVGLAPISAGLKAALSRVE